jgi:Pretoxin HINT domain
LAVLSPAGQVRSRAIEALKRRDPRDVIGRLIRLVHKPFKYEVRRPGPAGSPGVLFAEGEQFNIERFYRSWLLTFAPPSRMFTPDVPFDPFNPLTAMQYTMGGQFPLGSLYAMGFGGAGTIAPALFQAPMNSGVYVHPGQSMAAMPPDARAIVNHARANVASQAPAYGLMFSAELLAAQRDWAVGRAIALAQASLEERLAMDVQLLESKNAQINLLDERTVPILTALTGQDLGVDSEKWSAWWADQLGYSYQSSTPDVKPTYTDIITIDDGRLSHSCFAAGTPVYGIGGLQPIESIRAGDRVLSQGTSTGQLAFQPVIAVHHNPPARTFRIVCGPESIVATGIHRFWVAGRGWRMARELKPGDRLRVVGGTVTIDAIEPDKTQPVYNLEVAENRDFFVGTNGLLVHDFSFVQPVLEPFDRQPDLGSPVPESK